MAEIIGEILPDASVTSSNFDYTVPFNPFYYKNRAEFLVLKSELEGMGFKKNDLFKEFRFNITQRPTIPLLEFEVRIAHTTLTDFGLDEKWSYRLLDSIQVYRNASLSVDSNGWLPLSFTTPFAWNGDNNLVVTLVRNGGRNYNQSGSIQFKLLPVNIYRYKGFRGDSASYPFDNEIVTQKITSVPSLIIVGEGEGGTPTLEPPKPTVTNINRTTISDEPNMDRATVTFTFDQDVIEWRVRTIGTDHDTGILADSGGAVSAGAEITAEVDYSELYGEGQNRVNIYGKNSDGQWTPYE